MSSIKDTYFPTKEALLRHVSERSSLQLVTVAVVESKNDRHGNVRMIKFGCRYHELFCKKNEAEQNTSPPPRKRARDSKNSKSQINAANTNDTSDSCPFFWVASHCNGDWYLDPFVDNHSHPQPTRHEMEQALIQELIRYSNSIRAEQEASMLAPEPAVSPIPAPLDLHPAHQPAPSIAPTPPKEPVLETRPTPTLTPIPTSPQPPPAPTPTLSTTLATTTTTTTTTTLSSTPLQVSNPTPTLSPTPETFLPQPQLQPQPQVQPPVQPQPQSQVLPKPLLQNQPPRPKPSAASAAIIMTANLTRALTLAKTLVASITGSTPPTTNEARFAIAEEILQILDKEHAERPLSKEMISLRASVQSLRLKVMSEPTFQSAEPGANPSKTVGSPTTESATATTAMDTSAAGTLPSPPSKPCEPEVGIRTATAGSTVGGPTMVKSN
ncbi:hypothetical protein BGZ94_000679 [Podila epigama]|nr:hypothetical protein BGZ94_000679 [Podila epigama]